MAWPFAGVGVGRVLGPRGRGPDLAQTLPTPHATGWWVWASGQQSCPLHSVALPGSSTVGVEPRVLVGTEPQLWDDRGPLHRALLTPTPGCCLYFCFTHEDSDSQM